MSKASRLRSKKGKIRLIFFSVVKVRISKVKPRKLIGKKAQVFRAWKGTREEMRALRNPKFSLSADEKCCAERARSSKKGKFLVMGTKPSRSGGDLKPTFIVPWSKTKVCLH